MRRRDLLMAALQVPSPGLRLNDVTSAAGIKFQHNNGAFGRKHLPETMGPGCAFLDYDNDGWLDILLLNGCDQPGHKRARSTPALYRNNRNGTFTDVTRAAGLDFEIYGMGVAVGDFDNDGFPDLYLTGVGQNRLLHNNGRGAFVDVTAKSGLGNRSGFSTSALWFDFDRDGLLDLFVCNYVRWTPDSDVFCSLDGRNKSYCTPEAYRGSTCWLFRNLGNGRFEDVTAKSGIFDSTAKALGVAMLDVDDDGWPDLVVANDTSPNRVYRNQRDGTFSEIGLRSGVAFSEDGKARAGMGVDVGYLDNSGRPTIAITNFDNEMTGLYQRNAASRFDDEAVNLGVGMATRHTLGFGCQFADLTLDGSQDLLIANGHIDETVRNIKRDATYAQAPHLFLNDGRGRFRDIASSAGPGFQMPRVARGLACGDFDNDGAPVLFRNDLTNGNRSIRFRLRGVKCNRDAIGAVVRLYDNGATQTRMVRSGSSYLSHSDFALTFGVGTRKAVDRVVVQWPDGRTDEHRNLSTGRTWLLVEEARPQALDGY
jgi:enediyne biosynthesis protein E4